MGLCGFRIGGPYWGTLGSSLDLVDLLEILICGALYDLKPEVVEVLGILSRKLWRLLGFGASVGGASAGSQPQSKTTERGLSWLTGSSQ